MDGCITLAVPVLVTDFLPSFPLGAETSLTELWVVWLLRSMITKLIATTCPCDYEILEAGEVLICLLLTRLELEMCVEKEDYVPSPANARKECGLQLRGPGETNPCTN